MGKKRISGLAAVLAAMVLAVPAGAHTLWLNATDHYPAAHSKLGAFCHVYFGWGHRYPVDGFLSRDDLDRFVLITPKGRTRPLGPNAGGFLATRVATKERGAHWVAVRKNPGFYTIYEEKGRIRHKLGPKTGLDSVVLSVYAQQYAKSLIVVGKTDEASLTRPVGHALEIIPRSDPKGLGVGDIFAVEVIFKGAPARYVTVTGTYAGFSTKDDFAYSTVTDRFGMAQVRILHRGPWLLKAKKKVPAQGAMKEKCNELSFTATLTCQIP